MRGSPRTSATDAVFEVTGVTASEILRRCAMLRAARAGGGPVPRPGWPFAVNAERPTWRLVDFADGSEVEFVWAAYASLLCRVPSEAETTERVGDLRAGCSRFQIAMRLALSPEGRAARNRRVSGIALPAIVAAGRALDLATRVRPLGTALMRAELGVSLASRPKGDRSRERAP